MGRRFGWAHITDALKVAKGVDKSIQFASGSTPAELSGSENFTFDYENNTLALTGSSEISGSQYVYGFSAHMATGNPTTITANVDVPQNYNSLLLGPITVHTGVTLAVGAGAVVKIKDISDI